MMKFSMTLSDYRELCLERNSEDHDSGCSWVLYLLPSAYEWHHILVLDDLKFESLRYANPGK